MLAAAGYHPSDLVDEGRSSVDSAGLAKAVAAVRALLVSADPSLADQYVALAGDFAGSERAAG